MNVEDMIMAIRHSIQDTIEPYQVGSEAIFNWLNEAYMRIQLESDQWLFFKQRGVLFRTEVGQQVYEVAGVREIDSTSVYLIEDGKPRWPLFVEPYASWINKERYTNNPLTSPYCFVIQPDGSFLIDPIPKVEFDVWCDYWIEPAPFTDGGSVPIWDEQYHDIVRLSALRIAALEWPEEKFREQLMTRVTDTLPPLLQSFRRKYLEPMRGARALL